MVSWTITPISLLDKRRNPTLKSLGPRAYRNAEKTKRRKAIEPKEPKEDGGDGGDNGGDDDAY